MSHTDPTGQIAIAIIPAFPAIVEGLTVLGGFLGGAAISNWLFKDAEYPANPDATPEQFRPIRGASGKQCEDGSVWERDKSGHGNRDGDGDQWKRWPNKGSWERGDKPQSIWPDGRIRE